MKRALVMAVLLVAGTLTGCTSQSCASWVAYESDEDRSRDADLVVVADTVVADGTMSILGFDANAYRVTIGDVEKGDASEGETIRVGSTADNCSDRPYGAGDPMLGRSALRMFLVSEGGQWRTLSPFDGVRPAP
ncbi:hypothetical protein BW34_01093 [Microbacterium oleivorans]|uniref:Lipoprotein n=2 Tax=Microbacterium oleivorans TaxID=273677 RepID=A0A031FV97_9MICO|nr:hypothetical protein BW34_01093 [Microbacterium oleivorans]